MRKIIPDKDEYEISIFSRSYGECIVMHIGDGSWVIIDSLLTERREPAALEYLASIGVSPESQVAGILFTHWHDDHVAGATDIVKKCSSAQVALSGALQKDEFKAFLKAAQVTGSGEFSSGVDELLGVLRTLKMQKRQAKWCWADVKILAKHTGRTFSFDALSPAQSDFEQLIFSIRDWALSDVDGTAKRIPSPARNHASVASAFVSGEDAFLFGADLETLKGAGWELIHEQVWGDRPKANFYKISHHGSITGHYGKKWDDLIGQNAVSVLTPWNRSSKLPKDDDVKRILERTMNGYAANRLRSKGGPKRANAVERSLREGGIKISAPDGSLGRITFRKATGTGWLVTSAEGGACHLDDFHRHGLADVRQVQHSSAA